MRALFLCLPVLMLAACAAPPAARQPSSAAQASTPASQPDAQACNADAASSLIGQPATAANIEAARSKSGAASVRVLGLNDPMTMDYRGDRLNLIKDADGKIVKISCG